MKRLLSYLILPAEISAFELSYLARMNRIALIFFCVHPPVFALVAMLAGSNPLKAALFSTAVLLGPIVAYRTLANPRLLSITYGFTAMCMGGLLVHFGQGPMQIEMHFYFFVLIALLAVFANPVVVVTAAVTVAAHHLVLWVVLPRSVFNYEATAWSVVVHALFVVLESVAACFVARSYFDNVIGLERIVARRTVELDDRNRELQLVLANVGQGFLTIDRAGRMSNARSAILEKWFGPATAGETFWSYLARVDGRTAEWFELGWSAVIEDIMPLELTIDQLPRRVSVRGARYELSCKPILVDEVVASALIVVSDVTVDVQRDEADQRARELIGIAQAIAKDRKGFAEFMAEGDDLVARIVDERQTERTSVRRSIHTLKGNASFFGLASVADRCHALEEQMGDGDERPSLTDLGSLADNWHRVHDDVISLQGDQTAFVEIEPSDLADFSDALRQGASRADLARRVDDWGFEPMDRRLARIADQAGSLARRMGKGGIEVRIEHNRIRLPATNWTPFWSAFTHLVRNAVDHGLETREERESRQKPGAGQILLRTARECDRVVIEIADDGRGVSWDLVAMKAERAGLPFSTRKHLVDALLADGITTRDSVTEFSGRGVGMAAMRGACEALGGTLEIESDAGVGTTVRMTVPLDAAHGGTGRPTVGEPAMVSAWDAECASG